MALARERWKMIRSVFLEKRNRDSNYSPSVPNAASVRRFLSFDLFSVNQSSSLNTDPDTTHWTNYIYGYSENHPNTAAPLVNLSVEIAFLPHKFSTEDLQGFNNTGNVCVWPSEEVMALYCLQNIDIFKGISVCELGSGMTGLAGMFLAKTGVPTEVMITDGNEKSVANIQAIIDRNGFNSAVNSTVAKASTELVVWKKDSNLEIVYGHLKRRFDIVLCADCLFFTEVHNELIVLLLHILKNNGHIIMFAPDRSGTVQTFQKVAKDRFHVEVIENYSDIVWRKHTALQSSSQIAEYNPNIHYPKLIRMKRKELL